MKSAVAALIFLLVSSIASQAQSLPPVEIPFDFVDGFILIKAHIDSRPGSLTLLLDSGAGSSILSLRAARRLHLKLGTQQKVEGVDAEAVAYNIEPLAVSAEGITLSTIPLALDLHNADQICSRPIDGLIGIDFFHGRITQIDYAAHKIRLMLDAPAETTASVLPIHDINGMMCVPVAVNGGKPRWTRLDTGCNDDIHWVIPRTQERKHREAMSIGFITDSSNNAESTVRLGDQVVDHVQACLHGKPIFPGEAGLLGSGILNQFTVTIDAPGHQLILAQAAAH